MGHGTFEASSQTFLRPCGACFSWVWFPVGPVRTNVWAAWPGPAETGRPWPESQTLAKGGSRPLQGKHPPGPVLSGMEMIDEWNGLGQCGSGLQSCSARFGPRRARSRSRCARTRTKPCIQLHSLNRDPRGSFPTPRSPIVSPMPNPQAWPLPPRPKQVPVSPFWATLCPGGAGMADGWAEVAGHGQRWPEFSGSDHKWDSGQEEQSVGGSQRQSMGHYGRGWATRVKRGAESAPESGQNDPSLCQNGPQKCWNCAKGDQAGYGCGPKTK